MSEFKGTPGPWEIVYRDDDNCMTMTVIAKKGSMGPTKNIGRLRDDKNQANVIAITWHQLLPWAGQEAFNNEEGEANDNLIAAAPELLECCMEFVTRTELGQIDGLSDCYLRLKSAIAKALGK